jgi:hypothetical protein
MHVSSYDEYTQDTALLSATAASQLTKDARTRSDALAVIGRALRIAAEKAGQTEPLWPVRNSLPSQHASGEAEELVDVAEAEEDGGALFTCFTGTQVQILTQKRTQVMRARRFLALAQYLYFFTSICTFVPVKQVN